MTRKELIQRQKMVVCMEYIARCINDEDIFEGWLMCGVPDGDIESENLDPTQVYEEDYMITDGFKDLMTCFLRKMSQAYTEGGLYCGGVVSGTKGE